MSPLGDPRTHFWLVSRMAKTQGVDLAQAMRDGRLDQDDWAEAVTRCRGCAEPGACSDWLERTEDAASPPDYCRNVHLLEALGPEAKGR